MLRAGVLNAPRLATAFAALWALATTHDLSAQAWQSMERALSGTSLLCSPVSYRVRMRRIRTPDPESGSEEALLQALAREILDEPGPSVTATPDPTRVARRFELAWAELQGDDSVARVDWTYDVQYTPWRQRQVFVGSDPHQLLNTPERTLRYSPVNQQLDFSANDGQFLLFDPPTLLSPTPLHEDAPQLLRHWTWNLLEGGVIHGSESSRQERTLTLALDPMLGDLPVRCVQSDGPRSRRGILVSYGETEPGRGQYWISMIVRATESGGSTSVYLFQLSDVSFGISPDAIRCQIRSDTTLFDRRASLRSLSADRRAAWPPAVLDLIQVSDES